MKLATLRQPRQGIILLVVLALITLFASIGVAFVYFSEQEVTKAAEQKAGETIKLPDADLLFNYVMRQVIFPTNNTASALVTQSLLENMYGRTNGTATGNVQAFNGTGWRSVFDPATGLDNLYQRNMQFRFYDEALHGSLNPPYTYPDHKHAFLGQVSANWTTFNNPPGNFSQWGPTAIARSFAREMKFRIAYTTNAGGSGFEDIILNPYSSNVFPSGTRHADFWRGINPLPIGDLPNAPVGDPLHRTYIPNATVLANPNGTAAMLNFTPDVARSLAFRPSGYTNPYFPPPTDLGGDVKNLPPEVRTLVGFNGRNPIFANNDSYWMDIGFPAIPYSNNKKIKPLAALFIMDNDGKTNLNVHGNLRGFDASGNFPTSSHGLGPWEVNLMKLGLSIEEMRALLAGNTVGATSVRGRNGFAPAALNFDPSTIQNSYLPLLRGTSPYAQLDVDGTHDGLPPTNDYARTINYQLAGEPLNPLPWQNQPAFPVGHSSGSAIEYLRGGAFRSPFFTSPFAQNQVIGNGVSDNTGSFQRTFPLSNQEMLYRFRDTGSDKLSSDVRKLISINNNPLNLPQLRWQMTMLSSDLNVAGVAPWWGPSPGNPLNYPPPPATPPYNIPFDLLTQGAAGVPVPLPAASPPVPPPPPFPGVPFNIGEFSHQHWRSIFGNLNRIDLTRQLPDYPLPANNNTQLDLSNVVVSSKYKIALHARQKMVTQLYNALVNLTHPDGASSNPPIGTPNLPARRWLAQIAVNIVDYIDNDDIPTWFQIPGTSGPDAENIVWGTELPRLVINEAYAETVNDANDALTNNRAQENYAINHWVELYNPFNNSGYGGVWPATAGPAPASDAEARLTVRDSANNVQSVYRLIVTSHLNISNIRNPGQPVQSNMGYPNSLLPGSTGNGVPQNNTISVVYFNTNGTDERVLPSNGNYGPADPSASPLISDGFYLVGPVQQPVGTGSHMATPTDPNFPAMNFVSPQMQLPNRVQRRYGRYDQAIGFDPVNVREAVLLQRLANPYLPHNPLPNATIGTETSDPNLPYNPYITVDYVDNLMPARAVERDEGPSDPLQPGQPDQDPVTQRHSIGKMQPYAALNNVETNQTLWRISTPNRDNDATVPTPLNDQIQHTFFRHNGIEYVAPSLPYTPPTAVNANTIKYPFDWLTHLDREPTSAAELLHVSGFKPHELTQQFNQMTRPINGLDVGNTTLNATGATTTLSFGASSDPYPNRFNGSHLGVPWSVKAGDQLLVTFSIGGTPALPRWVRVTAVAPDYSSVTVVAGNMGATPVDATASVQVIVPFAHQAPWYRAEQNVDVQSSSRIYRLLEVVSTRNPGIDAGQMRFTSGVTGPGIINMNTANNVGEPDPVYNDGSRWIQLDNARIVVGSESFPGTHLSSTVQVTVNDALIRIPGSSAAGGTSLTTVPYNNFLAAPIDGEHLVARWIDTFSGNPVVQRVTILERDLPNNRIRVVLNNLPSAIATGGGTLPMTFDYAYIAGRALGKINLNTMFDLETWRALADAQPINSFWEAAPPADREAWVDRVFRRLYQQRQPGYFTRLQSQLPGHTGLNGVGEDRPFQGQAAGDIPFSGNIPLQGIGNTFLSDRYQESLSGPNLFGAGIRSGVNGDMFSPVPVVPTDIPGDNTEIRYLRTLFELGNPGEDHPYRRFELLRKIWNNVTTRSNTFTIWMTIGFFEFDDVNGLGAELGQIQGKNTRYRFFAVVDRTTIDSWLQSWNLHNPPNSSQPASINLFVDTGLFPTLDPRQDTYPNINRNNPGITTVISTNYARVPVSPMLPGEVEVTPASTNPFTASDIGRLVQVESEAGTERGEILGFVGPNIRIRLVLQHTGVMAIRALPVPATVLYWSQLK